MKGNNSININENTMVEAIQYYFDHVLFKSDRSPRVKFISQTQIGVNPKFEIKIEGKEQKNTLYLK